MTMPMKRESWLMWCWVIESRAAVIGTSEERCWQYRMIQLDDDDDFDWRCLLRQQNHCVMSNECLVWS